MQRIQGLREICKEEKMIIQGEKVIWMDENLK